MQTEADVEVLNIEINASGVDKSKTSIGELKDALKSLKEFGKSLTGSGRITPPDYSRALNNMKAPIQTLKTLAPKKNSDGISRLCEQFTNLSNALSGFDNTQITGFKSVSLEVQTLVEVAKDLEGVQKLLPALSKLPEILRTYRAGEGASFKRCTSTVSEAIGQLNTGEDVRTLNGRLKGLRKTLDSYGELNVDSFEHAADVISRMLPALDGEKNAKSISKLSIQFSRLREVLNGFNGIQLTGFKNASREIEKMVETMKKLNDVPNLKDFMASVKQLSKIKEEQPKTGPEIPDAPDLSGKLSENVWTIERLKSKFLELNDTISTTMPKSVAVLSRFGGVAKGVLAKIGSGSKKVGTKLKSIILYKALGAMVSFVTKGLKEGVNNLYQYSKASDGVFSKSMDKIATSTMYVKNAFGSLTGALIQDAAPYLEGILDKIGDCVNEIRKFYAEVTGAKTWTRAKKIPVEFAEAAENAVGATEKLKRAILGFDKLNILDFGSQLEKAAKAKAPSKPKYSTMFEEVSVVNNTNEKLSRLKSALNRVGESTTNLFSQLFSDEMKTNVLDTLGDSAIVLLHTFSDLNEFLNRHDVLGRMLRGLTLAVQEVTALVGGIRIVGKFLSNPYEFSRTYLNMDWAIEHSEEWAELFNIPGHFDAYEWIARKGRLKYKKDNPYGSMKEYLEAFNNYDLDPEERQKEINKALKNMRAPKSDEEKAVEYEDLYQESKNSQYAMPYRYTPITKGGKAPAYSLDHNFVEKFIDKVKNVWYGVKSPNNSVTNVSLASTNFQDVQTRDNLRLGTV